MAPRLTDALDCVLAWRHARGPGPCRWHRHDGCELVVHLSGAGSVAHRGHPARPFAVGACTLHPCGLPHQQVFTGHGEDLCLHFVANGPLPERLRRPLVSTPLPSSHLAWARAALPGPDGEATRLAALGLLAAALERSQPGQAEGGSGDAAVGAIQLMQELPAHPWQVAELAAAVGCSTRHLQRRCRAVHGCAPKTLHQRLRRHRAEQLLRHSELTLAEIAAQCGYAHARHLCAAFHAAHGCAPGAWRERVGR